jgi:Uma2 family endonuclease
MPETTTRIPPGIIPPLENGDRLTRDEFERRYHAMPHIKKAELIEGVVYMPSPVRANHHGNPHYQLIGWVSVYTNKTPGIYGYDNTTVRLDVHNEPQPDVALVIDPRRGGQARISADDYLEHAPELVVEIAASSASIDTNTKAEVYRRTGVREYIIWRVNDEEIDWFVLRDEKFVPLVPDAKGVYKSEVFPGLWLDADALIRDDRKRLDRVARKGASSPEHAAFVEKLEDVAL